MECGLLVCVFVCGLIFSYWRCWLGCCVLWYCGFECWLLCLDWFGFRMLCCWVFVMVCLLGWCCGLGWLLDLLVLLYVFVFVGWFMLCLFVCIWVVWLVVVLCCSWFWWWLLLVCLKWVRVVWGWYGWVLMVRYCFSCWFWC